MIIAYDFNDYYMINKHINRTKLSSLGWINNKTSLKFQFGRKKQ